ncbi:MAG: glycolate oxidase subunit GlcE [Gammaproteobacteria bacterium]|nr:glycolate oxidase subunit GlcE [Gammaproteobacteria bacterium]
MNADISLQLQQQVQRAFEEKLALRIVGGNSKAFYGCPVSAETLSVAEHRGVLNYEPTELVITVRAGTPLKEIETLLDDEGQMLPFEPPAFSEHATLGGIIACNLSGPRRAYAGAARDYLLGCKIINGKGEILTFGGEVMKNVAGYDVSRLMAGAMGSLGVLLEVSLKVLPKAETEATQLFHCSSAEAIDKMHSWSQTPLPVSATSFHDSMLRVRLSGAGKAVIAAVNHIGGDAMENADQYWQDLKEQRLEYFNTEKNLWRLSLASDVESVIVENTDEDDFLYEWGGALRWLKSDVPAEIIQAAVAELDGHASLFRPAGVFRDGEQSTIFQPLTPGLMRIHKNLKQAFDPNNILNPGKLYPEL